MSAELMPISEPSGEMRESVRAAGHCEDTLSIALPTCYLSLPRRKQKCTYFRDIFDALIDFHSK